VVQTATLYGCGDGGVPGVDAPSMPVLTYQTRTYLASCEQVPTTDWQEVTLATEGDGRLTTPVFSIGGAPFEWNTYRVFSDASLGVDCLPRSASDGSLRCIPNVRGAVAFADASCASRVVASNSGPEPYALEGSIPGNLFPNPRGTITVYAVGALRPAGPIYVRTPAGCSRLDGWTSYEIGAVVPPSTFVALELRDAP
jgi:hypothetical protein